MGGSTIEYLEEVCDGNVFHIQNHNCTQGGTKWDKYQDLDYFKVTRVKIHKHSVIYQLLLQSNSLSQNSQNPSCKTLLHFFTNTIGNTPPRNLKLIKPFLRLRFFYAIASWTFSMPFLIFQIGVSLKYAGYHCSWCLSPEGISVKLHSAIHQDFLRWG